VTKSEKFGYFSQLDVQVPRIMVGADRIFLAAGRYQPSADRRRLHQAHQDAAIAACSSEQSLLA
jgi:hypothetical protein